MGSAIITKGFSIKKCNRFLFFLLLVDAIFISIHLLMKLEAIEMPGKFWLDWEGGYTEYFQYIKYILILLCSLFLIKVRRESSYLPWFFLFFVLLLDDAYTFHERSGEFLANTLRLKPRFGLRDLDIGELIYSFMAGTIFALSLGIAYRKGSSNFKKTSIDITMLFSLLIFFGVVVDAIHAYFNNVDKLSGALVMIEDGGEMIALSLLAWYFYFAVSTDPGHRLFLYRRLYNLIRTSPRSQ